MTWARLLTIVLTVGLASCGPPTVEPGRGRTLLAQRLETTPWDGVDSLGIDFNSVGSERVKVINLRSSAVTFYELIQTKRVGGRFARVSYYIFDSSWQAFGEFVQTKLSFRKLVQPSSSTRRVVLDGRERFCARFEVEIECFQTSASVLVHVALVKRRPHEQIWLDKVETLMDVALKHLDYVAAST